MEKIPNMAFVVKFICENFIEIRFQHFSISYVKLKINSTTDIFLFPKNSGVSFRRTLRKYLANESLLKMMKNAFYFTLKALFVLEILRFLPWLFDHV